MNIFEIIGSKKLKILFVAAEAAPFAKVGGLSSVMYSLPKALARLGHDARVMIPRYLPIEDVFYHLKTELEEINVPTKNENGPEELVCNVKRYDPTGSEKDSVTTYFLENQEYYEKRANVYGYADDPVRWMLLSRGVLEFLRLKKGWIPDVIVCSDWQTALIPNLLKTEYNKDPVLNKIATVLSIHNLYFQSMFDHKFVTEMDFDDGHSPIPAMENPRLSKINFLRRGIIYADAINTVSPNYSREIMTKEYGETLDELLRERKAVISGILNGIDYDIWNPARDSHIAEKYSIKNLERRMKNKTALQRTFNLPVNNNVFVACIVSRMTKQKGLDLLFPIIDTLLKELPIQLIIVGDGESEVMSFFHDLETRFPDRVAAHLKFDSILSHIVFAGSDVVIVPSRFEPCGLAPMEAMRMGTIPIVRKTGGLADSVEDYDPETQTGTGFTFERFDSSSLMISLIRAFVNFRDKTHWRQLQARAMAKDFSWDTSAVEYVELFDMAIDSKNIKNL